VTGVLLSSLLGAASQAAVSSSYSRRPTLPEAWAAGAASEITSAGQQIVRRNLDIQPTIRIPPGDLVNVLVARDLVIPPVGVE
jgi:type IV secretory pathway VirB10-like protein